MENLSPMDSFAYFDTPTETIFTHTQADGVFLCAPADPRRVLLIFGNGTPGTWILSTNSNVVTSFGIPLLATTLPFVLNNHDHGPLTQIAWFALATVAMPGSQNLSVIEVKLMSWPRRRKHGVTISIQKGPADRNGHDYIDPNRRFKPPPEETDRFRPGFGR